jgi:hypothetical protein
MPNIAVVDMAGKNVGEITLSDAIFGIAPNAVVMHMAVVNYLANQRQGTQSTLTRTEVSGGGKKPWRQRVQATQDRALPEHLSGDTVVLFTHPSREIILTLSTKRFAD